MFRILHRSSSDPNATHDARHQQLWGDVTTTASDSTKFGAWDQNLLTEWHTRYKGPGVMTYWHVDRKSAGRTDVATQRHRGPST